jgi:hypothetical protein
VRTHAISIPIEIKISPAVSSERTLADALLESMLAKYIDRTEELAHSAPL